MWTFSGRKHCVIILKRHASFKLQIHVGSVWKHYLLNWQITLLDVEFWPKNRQKSAVFWLLWAKNVCKLPQLLPMKDISYFYNFVLILGKLNGFINVTFMKNNCIFYISDREQFHWWPVTSYTTNMQYGSKFVTWYTANMMYIMLISCITSNWLANGDNECGK